MSSVIGDRVQSVAPITTHTPGIPLPVRESTTRPERRITFGATVGAGVRTGLAVLTPVDPDVDPDPLPSEPVVSGPFGSNGTPEEAGRDVAAVTGAATLSPSDRPRSGEATGAPPPAPVVVAARILSSRP